MRQIAGDPLTVSMTGSTRGVPTSAAPTKLPSTGYTYTLGNFANNLRGTTPTAADITFNTMPQYTYIDPSTRPPQPLSGYRRGSASF